MKNKIHFTLGILSFALAIQSCIYINDRDHTPSPRGNSTEDFTVAAFNKLEMGDAFTINVKKAAQYSVKASGELNDLNDLSVRTNTDGELRISYRNSWRKRHPMQIDITMPDLAEVDFSGASVAQIEGFESLGILEIELSGASRASFYGSANRLEAELSGASELTLSGSGQMLEVESNGASRLNAYDFPCKTGNLELSGASSNRVNLSQTLWVQASGASTVRWKGNAVVTQKLTGGSSVIRE